MMKKEAVAVKGSKVVYTEIKDMAKFSWPIWLSGIIAIILGLPFGIFNEFAIGVLVFVISAIVFFRSPMSETRRMFALLIGGIASLYLFFSACMFLLGGLLFLMWGIGVGN